MRLNGWSRGAQVAYAGFIVGVVALGVAAFSGGAALAQRPATRGLTPIPGNDTPSVELSATVDPKPAKVGTTVQVCFSASQAGYVSLYDVSATEQVARIFPNQYAPAAVQVEAGKRYCAGANNDPYKFRVDPPVGMEELYLLWTTKPEYQPASATYPSTAAWSSALQERLAGADASQWKTFKNSFDIVPTGGPVAAPNPPVATTGQIKPPPGNDTAPPPVADNTPPPQPPTISVPGAPPAPAGNDSKPPPRVAGNDDTVPPPSPTPTPPAPRPVAQNGPPQVWVFAMGANVGELTKSNQDAAMFTSTVQKVFAVPDDHIAFKENGTSKDFTTGMQWLSDVAGPKDYVFVYFSGHGTQIPSDNPAIGMETYIVPYDYDLEHPDPRTLIWSQRLDYLVNRLQTKRVVLVMDSCFSAGITRGLSADVLGARKKFLPLPAATIAADIEGGKQGGQGGGAQGGPEPGGSRRLVANGLLLAAAHKDQSALEGADGSFFTVAIAQEMGSADGGSLMDVFARAEHDTQEWTKNRQGPEAVGDKALGQSILFTK